MGAVAGKPHSLMEHGEAQNEKRTAVLPFLTCCRDISLVSLWTLEGQKLFGVIIACRKIQMAALICLIFQRNLIR